MLRTKRMHGSGSLWIFCGDNPVLIEWLKLEEKNIFLGHYATK